MITLETKRNKTIINGEAFKNLGFRSKFLPIKNIFNHCIIDPVFFFDSSLY